MKFATGAEQWTVQPLSDTVPLWFGSSFGAFVYIGNDGCMFCSWLKHINRKDKFGFYPFPSNTRSGKTLSIKF